MAKCTSKDTVDRLGTYNHESRVLVVMGFVMVVVIVHRLGCYEDAI